MGQHIIGRPVGPSYVPGTLKGQSSSNSKSIGAQQNVDPTMVAAGASMRNKLQAPVPTPIPEQAKVPDVPSSLGQDF